MTILSGIHIPGLSGPLVWQLTKTEAGNDRARAEASSQGEPGKELDSPFPGVCLWQGTHLSNLIQSNHAPRPRLQQSQLDKVSTLNP